MEEESILSILSVLQAKEDKKISYLKKVIMENLKEEKLTNDYIKNYKNNFCRNFFISHLKNIKNRWEVELGCDASSGASLSPGNFQMKRGGLP